MNRPRINLNVKPQGTLPIDLMPYRPSDETRNHVLGEGTFKRVWITDPNDNLAVINATNAQVAVKGEEDTRFEQVFEFFFTLMLGKIMPDLIPKVYLIEPNYTFIDPGRNRFRYFKEIAPRLNKTKETFYQMADIVENFISQGFAYLDIKPSNLGMVTRNGEKLVVSIDTSPYLFYRVPYNIRKHFRIAILMTMIGFSNKNDVCHKHILGDFVRKHLPTEDIEFILNDPYVFKHPYVFENKKELKEKIIEESMPLFASCFEQATGKVSSEYSQDISKYEDISKFMMNKIKLPFDECVYYSLDDSHHMNLSQKVAHLSRLFKNIRNYKLISELEPNQTKNNTNRTQSYVPTINNINSQRSRKSQQNSQKNSQKNSQQNSKRSRNTQQNSQRSSKRSRKSHSGSKQVNKK
jgi:hypothetical protein